MRITTSPAARTSASVFDNIDKRFTTLAKRTPLNSVVHRPQRSSSIASRPSRMRKHCHGLRKALQLGIPFGRYGAQCPPIDPTPCPTVPFQFTGARIPRLRKRKISPIGNWRVHPPCFRRQATRSWISSSAVLRQTRYLDCKTAQDRLRGLACATLSDVLFQTPCLSCSP